MEIITYIIVLICFVVCGSITIGEIEDIKNDNHYSIKTLQSWLLVLLVAVGTILPITYLVLKLLGHGQ